MPGGRRVGHARRRVAGVGRAWVPVVHRGRRSADACPGRVARPRAAAGVALSARHAFGRRVSHAGRSRARIHRARVVVIQIRRIARYARPGRVARLRTVARIGVAARGPRCSRSVAHPGRRVAAIHRANIAVVRRERRPGGARARAIARLGAVAGVAVGAAPTCSSRAVRASQHGIARVGRARVPVIDRERRPRAA